MVISIYHRTSDRFFSEYTHASTDRKDRGESWCVINLPGYNFSLCRGNNHPPSLWSPGIPIDPAAAANNLSLSLAHTHTRTDIHLRFYSELSFHRKPRKVGGSYLAIAESRKSPDRSRSSSSSSLDSNRTSGINDRDSSWSREANNETPPSRRFLCVLDGATRSKRKRNGATSGADRLHRRPCR